MNKKIAIAVALATLAASTFAAEPGFYAGADVGSTHANDISGHPSSYGAEVGYTFNVHWSGELGYRHIATWDILKSDETVISVIGTLPLAKGFNVFARYGRTFIDLKSRVSYVRVYKEHSDGALFGAGLGYDFNSKWAGRLEVQSPASGWTNITAGVVYSFK
jgi:hypothetical protein